MSEMEELKRNAEISKAKQHIDAMNAYIQQISAELDHAWRKEHQSWTVYIIAWLVWVLSNFVNHIPLWGPIIDMLGFFIFLGGWLYTFYWGRELALVGGKYKGMMKTLFLLGYIDWDPEDPGHRARLKEGVWAKGAALVKSWATKKKAAQDKVFAPA